MTTTKRSLLPAIAALCLSLCVAPSTFATPTASMDLTSAGSAVTGTNVLDGVYVGAYTATIGGVSTPVICDDYADNSYVPETWTANVNTFSSLSGTKWGSLSNSTQLYEEAAWLIEQMVNPANSGQVGDISFAIWGLFDPTAVSDLQSYSAANGTSDYSNSQNWLSQAQSNYTSLTSADLADFTIYTPISPSDALCGGSPCATAPPQEFMTYSAAEPSFVMILGADLLLFGCAVVFLRRRGILTVVR